MSAATAEWYPFGGPRRGWLFKRSPRFTNRIPWEGGSFLRTPLNGEVPQS